MKPLSRYGENHNLRVYKPCMVISISSHPQWVMQDVGFLLHYINDFYIMPHVVYDFMIINFDIIF